MIGIHLQKCRCDGFLLNQGFISLVILQWFSAMVGWRQTRERDREEENEMRLRLSWDEAKQGRVGERLDSKLLSNIG